MRYTILALATVLVPLLQAQIPDDLRALMFSEQRRDVFLESFHESGEWGETAGWVHYHWLGDEVVSGETTLTHVLVTHTVQIPDWNPPPVMIEATLSVEPEGVALHEMRFVRPDEPTFIQTFPPQAWIMPLPVEQERTWTIDGDDMRVWARIESIDAISPHPDFPDEPCIQILRVAAELTASEEVHIETETRWMAPELGPLWIEQATGTIPDLDWNSLPADALGTLLDRADELPDHTTLRRVMPPNPE